MTNLIKILVLTTGLVVTTSFADSIKYNFIGTYGVSESDPAQVQLTLIEDNTFVYKDFSNPQKKIDIKGNWELNGRVVTLKDHNSQHSFHSKWKFLKGGQIAKSRKGMTY